MLGRAVPDVTAHTANGLGCPIYIGGQCRLVGGRLGAAALWAGAIALLNQGLERRLGFLNEALYTRLGPAGALRDIVSGGIGDYQAGPGWDLCSGWGSPDGGRLLQMLAGPNSA